MKLSHLTIYYLYVIEETSFSVTHFCTILALRICLINLQATDTFNSFLCFLSRTFIQSNVTISKLFLVLLIKLFHW